MFQKISDDILLTILFNITNVNDVINLSITDKTMYESINNDIYIDWGRNMYSKEFWNKAITRTQLFSKPLIQMKLELLRIKNFVCCQKKHGQEIWTKNDYYKYWDAMELYINKTIKPINLI